MRLNLARTSMVAVFDYPDIAQALTTTLPLDALGATETPDGMQVAAVALIAQRAAADPSPSSLAGCQYSTR